MNELRLFVVGESSGDPAEWSPYSCRCLVFAENAEAAKELAGDWGSGPAVEVVPTKSVAFAHECH